MFFFFLTGIDYFSLDEGDVCFLAFTCAADSHDPTEKGHGECALHV